MLHQYSDSANDRGIVCGYMSPPRLEAKSCAAPTLALAQVHTANRLHFAESNDGYCSSSAKNAGAGA